MIQIKQHMMTQLLVYNKRSSFDISAPKNHFCTDKSKVLKEIKAPINLGMENRQAHFKCGFHKNSIG